MTFIFWKLYSYSFDLHISAVIIHRILFKENLLKEFYKTKQINLSLNFIFFLYLRFISFKPSESSFS